MRRGFEKVSGYEYVNLPQRKTKQSAGYDIESAVNVVINPGETKLIPTGIKVYMDENEWMGIYIRSSIAVKHGIVLANSVAVIDSDYYNNPDNEGHIMLPIRNVSGMPYTVKKETESHKEYFIDITRWMATALMVIGPAE